MSLFLQIAQIASCITMIAAALALFVKPIREKIFNTKKTTDGEKCLLRSEMLRIYYRHLDEHRFRQYEFENFIKLYEAYKALGGNSFIDEIYEEVEKWKIIS